MLYLGDDMVTSHMAEQIQYAGQAPPMFQYIHDRFEWTDNNVLQSIGKELELQKKTDLTTLTPDHTDDVWMVERWASEDQTRTGRAMPLLWKRGGDTDTPLPMHEFYDERISCIWYQGDGENTLQIWDGSPSLFRLHRPDLPDNKTATSPLHTTLHTYNSST
jgi:hypothetical protein